MHPAICPGFGAITIANPIFTSNYNSLQVSLNRRLSNSLTLGVGLHLVEASHYAAPWIAILGDTNTYDLKADYGPSTLNTPQIFVLSYVYDLPFFKNQSGICGIRARRVGNLRHRQHPDRPVAFDQSKFRSVRRRVSSHLGGQLRNLSDYYLLSALSWRSGHDPARQHDSSPRRPGQRQCRRPENRRAILQYGGLHRASGLSAPETSGRFMDPGFQLWDMSLIKNIDFGGAAELATPVSNL